MNVTRRNERLTKKEDINPIKGKRPQKMTETSQSEKKLLKNRQKKKK